MVIQGSDLERLPRKQRLQPYHLHQKLQMRQQELLRENLISIRQSGICSQLLKQIQTEESGKMVQKGFRMLLERGGRKLRLSKVLKIPSSVSIKDRHLREDLLS